MTARDVEITLDQIGGKDSRVVVAGQDVSALVQGLTLVSRAGDLTTLILNIAPAMARVRLQGEVDVDSAAYALLVDLGWTPPLEVSP